MGGRFLSALLSLAALCAVATGPAPASAADQTAARFAPFFASLRPCQIYQLGSSGYLRVTPSRFYISQWSVETLREMARDARRRPYLRLDLRSTVQLQLSRASSFQAGTTYDALADFLERAGIKTIERAPFIRAADAAYRAALAAEGFASCFVFKWGNRHPDFFAQPMRLATWRAIERLFVEGGAAQFPLNAVEEGLVADGTLDVDEVAELRNIRIAVYLFEREFAVLAADLGGFGGNLEDDPIVCTDETTTMWFFVERLAQAGWLTKFTSQDGRFVWRRPTEILPTDHFGLLLRNRRTGAYFALDSWVEDGGVPPHIASVDDWFDLRERRSVVSIGDALLDDALAEGRVTHADEDGLLTRLRAHLARFEPADQAPRPDGRPQICKYYWCGPQPIAAW